MSETDKIYPALFRVQQKMLLAKKNSTNPYFDSKYADLGAVLEACEPALNSEGIMLIQPTNEKGIETRLVHLESGQILSGLVPYAGISDMQKLGGAITYGRRFGLKSLLGMEEQDDDGETAVGRTAQAQNKTAIPKPIESPKSAPISKPGGSGAFCDSCDTELVISKSGAGYYCPQFKTPGEHTRFKVEDLESFKNARQDVKL